MMSGHLGLSENLPYFLPHPTAWLLLGPTELLFGATVLFPLDAVAEYVGVAAGRRLVLGATEAILVWPVVAIWGHPEDPLAMTFALYGLLAALRGRWKRCGWLWGAALVTQPLVVLMLPVAFALAPMRRWAGMALRGVLPSLALVTFPLVQEWGQTSRALLQQPNYPSIDHATPWVGLAPVLSPAHQGVTRQFGRTASAGHEVFTTTLVTSGVGKVVAAGPGRLIAIALAVLIGAWVYRSRPSTRTIVWCAAAGLALRCVFESVMDPYYLWPPLALGILTCTLASRRRLATVLALAAVDSLYAYRHMDPWAWYLPVVVMLLLAVGLSRPAAGSSGNGRDLIRDSQHERLNTSALVSS
jgi:hypothetical protein